MSSVALQSSVYAKLFAANIAGVVAIYDNVKQVADPDNNDEFPFITLSEGSSQPWDTDTETGHDAIAQIHVWSRAQHSLEAKGIMDGIYDALHRATLTITGQSFVGCDYINRTEPQRDPDGITRHGIIEFKIVYEEA